MCTQILKFMCDIGIEFILQSVHQSSSTSGTFKLKNPTSCQPQMEFLTHKISSSVENSLRQAISELIGVDIPVRISSKFTQAIATEVLHGSLSSTAPASCQASTDAAAEKCLAGAISMMKSFLTGRGTFVKRKILTQKGLDNKEETPAKGHSTRKESPRRRCFNGRQSRKIQPAPLEDLTETRRVQKSTRDSPSQETEAKKRDSFCVFFCNIFSRVSMHLRGN